MKFTKSKKITVILLMLLNISIISGGDVYLVIGSDTAIWDGMSTNRFNCFYNVDLYTNLDRNAYKVMDPSFRARLVDSDGQPLKMTWWMMAGNIFRYAENKNVPVPNIMTLYLMKKYHGENVLINGDELSLHYHTFIWSDFNNDGRYYWNQAQKFTDCLDDFNYTLAQFLLEESVFPVSFRSGWHYMDNDWQKYLNERILPYSMHNDYPSKHVDNQEPIDNNYDWSLAPSAFIPYHPSEENYQIPGNSPGWNVRSAHFWKVIRGDLLDTVFAAAQKGEDQVACFWGHLPESDFINSIETIDSLAHDRVKKYPDVKFYYTTAVEAMQRWRQSTDTQAPQIEFFDEVEGDNVYFTVKSHEAIFQKQPFVAVKDVYEDYRVLPCVPTGIHTWRTTVPVSVKYLAKAGVAVCDSFGNQTLKFIQYLPDDAFIDNSDDGFSEIKGSWYSETDGTPWGTDARYVQLAGNDTAIAKWTYTLPQSAYYNIFVQIPLVSNLARKINYIVYLNGQPVDTVLFDEPLPSNDWVYLSTSYANRNDEIAVELHAGGKDQSGRIVAADVVKISGLVRNRDLRLKTEIINFGEVSWGDTLRYDLELTNLGSEELTVKTIKTQNNTAFARVDFPLVIPAMSKEVIPLYFYSEQLGEIQDTLVIRSDDPRKGEIRLPVVAFVQKYFEIIDNEDSLNYEESGTWYYSVAQAYGPTSRYAWLNSKPVPYARFFTKLKKSGVYELFEMVPRTENSTDKAIYEFRIDGAVVDSVFIDQNEGSGNWVSLGLHFIPADIETEIRVIDSRQSTKGSVLRADAVKFALIREITDLSADEKEGFIPDFSLSQNYPNPFNSATKIIYQIPEATRVKIVVFNVLGEKVKTLIDAYRISGTYHVSWNGRDDYGNSVASGIYYYKIITNKFMSVKKMIYIR
ncbi:MAG: T9SS type A sorting domain-containing protein [Calditrichaeota bacterium]|nr:T9SS type A sorting domain-containing protein [Calditrichota bacterium]